MVFCGKVRGAAKSKHNRIPHSHDGDKGRVTSLLVPSVGSRHVRVRREGGYKEFMAAHLI
jgi:hypothetical protein